MNKGEMLANALKLASEGHYGQFDKGGNPYILHPLKVMHYTRSDDEEVQCIALLHDLIEDTKTTYEDLKNAGMSERVIVAVKLLTKQRGQSYEEYKLAVMSNLDALKVKMADLRHNTDIRRLKGLKETDMKRMEKYFAFYTELKEKLNECNCI